MKRRTLNPNLLLEMAHREAQFGGKGVYYQGAYRSYAEMRLIVWGTTW